ncbi:conserved hypothetical protein [Cenarchaeum symbiosum A]|uniref:DUF7669 domain-containing protein n=1 Tax=Cenarchaeum symbiosum (strain A) TaxID=414004 RepID=A0RUX3_CENSY|nr:conserved hypothetical protein [Cenarchaeum symbiosum A]
MAASRNTDLQAEKLLHLIRSSKGAYMGDLRGILGISQEEMSGLATRLKMDKSVEIKEVHRGGAFFDFMLTYRESTGMPREGPEKDGLESDDDTEPRAVHVPTAVAVWIAAATLHREHGKEESFTKDAIISKVREQELCSVSDSTIETHVTNLCVANSAASRGGSPHRKLYRTGRGMYRLYKRGERFHPSRKSGPITPKPSRIPEEYADLRKWYSEVYCSRR